MEGEVEALDGHLSLAVEVCTVLHGAVGVHLGPVSVVVGVHLSAEDEVHVYHLWVRQVVKWCFSQDSSIEIKILFLNFAGSFCSLLNVLATCKCILRAATMR